MNNFLTYLKVFYPNSATFGECLRTSVAFSLFGNDVKGIFNPS